MIRESASTDWAEIQGGVVVEERDPEVTNPPQSTEEIAAMTRGGDKEDERRVFMPEGFERDFVSVSVRPGHPMCRTFSSTRFRVEYRAVERHLW